MQITILSYIGREDDIVDAFVTHSLRFADKIVIVSTEKGATREKLHQMEQDGLSITVTDHQPAYHDQHEVLSKLLTDAAIDTDWILPLDADEFVTGDIRFALTNADRAQPHALVWRTYVPTTEDDLTEADVTRRIRHRRTKESPQFTKIVIPSSIITANTVITQGNHAVIDEKGNRFEGHILPDVFLAHFPVRSSSQMQSKIDRSWPAVARNPARLSTEATHWKTLHEQFAGQEIDAGTLTEIALHYASSADTQTPALIEDPIS